MLRTTIYTALLLLFLTPASQSQDTIRLENPSFEDIPRAGGIGYSGPIEGWQDCGLAAFPGESAPDIHPHPEAWKVDVKPADGKTFLGLVVRLNDSWEFIGQKLSNPIQADMCYSMTVQLTRSKTYFGLRDFSRGADEPTFSRDFTAAVALRIWGGQKLCDKKELLFEVPLVKNTDWETYELNFQAESTHKFIIVEAFYKTPTLTPYNGHILIDNFSDIIQVDCN